MAGTRAHEVDRFLAKPDPKFRIILIYGPDTGLVSERAKTFANNSGVDLNDPFSLVSLDADDAAGDRLRITDEANTVGMFGGDRLIWIRGSTRKNLIAALQPLLDQPPMDAWVLVEAGDLKKSSPLRSKIEKSPNAMALPCYQDEQAALGNLIDQEMAGANLTIDADTKQYLMSLLGGDRLASRGEVQKLCLFAHGKTHVALEDVTAIVGDASTTSMDQIIDAAAIGDLPELETGLSTLLATGTPASVILNAAQRHFQMLHRARATMQQNRLSVQAVVGSWRPMLNFRRKPIVTRAMHLWTFPALERALSRLDKANLQARQNASLATSITSTALLALAIEAKRTGQRNH